MISEVGVGAVVVTVSITAKTAKNEVLKCILGYRPCFLRRRVCSDFCFLEVSNGVVMERIVE